MLIIVALISLLGIFFGTALVIGGLKTDNFKVACIGMALIILVVLLTIISFQLVDIKASI